MRLKLNRKVCRVLLILALLVLALALLLKLLSLWEDDYGTLEAVETEEEQDLVDENQQISWNGNWYVPKSGLETVLLLGVDKYEEQTGEESYLNYQQSDFLMLLVIDTQSDCYTALHLNRDTMTDISVLGASGEVTGTINAQLALAHTYGSGGTDSCENTVEAVSNLLYGVEIDHYVSMTMDGVAVLNDLAGGVTLEVMDDMTSADSALVKGETVTLRGEQALAYVRTRKGLEDSSNLHRMQRQRQYLEALRQQVAECARTNTNFLLSSILAVNDYLVSDCTVEELSQLANTLNGFTMTEVCELDGEAVEGETYMEYYVDEQTVQELILKLFYDEAN